jgi:hypothetical protein
MPFASLVTITFLHAIEEIESDKTCYDTEGGRDDYDGSNFEFGAWC